MARLIKSLLFIALLLTPYVIQANVINEFSVKSSPTHFCAESSDTVEGEDPVSEEYEEEEPECD